MVSTFVHPNEFAMKVYGDINLMVFYLVSQILLIFIYIWPNLRSVDSSKYEMYTYFRTEGVLDKVLKPQKCLQAP